jgi:transcriptional regulator with XRE-family HTH domain
MALNERLQELSDFLKTRRARLNPKDVGLPNTSRRRTPGLRREEVAELANISATWYTWLEQGRPIKVSIRTGALIAKALHLDDSERSHFFKLLEQPQAAELESAEAESLDYEIQSVLDGLQFHPTFVLNHRWDLLAWNRAAEFVLHFGEGSETRRNFIRFIFSSRYFKSVSINWESDVRGILAQFRLDYDQYVHEDATLEQQINLLRREVPEFRQWWSEHAVMQRTGWGKELIHPDAQLLNFKSMVLERTSAPFPRVVIYVPEPASLQKIAACMPPLP